MTAAEWYTGGQPGPAGRVTVDFGSGAAGEPIVTTVADGGVRSDSVIVCSISVPASRDADEGEFINIDVRATNIVPGVSFDIIAEDIDGGAEGPFTINFTRS
jgi:hypothetical protein